MGDHFVFLVDRLLTESTLEAAIESRSPLKQQIASENENAIIDCSFDMDSETVKSPRKLVECRICQEEDLDSNLETPCSCCGSLKYAHRRCVQRWCNEKGDTICEICHQQFKPGYTAPPSLFRLGRIPMNLRGHWQMSRRGDPNNPPFVTVVSTNRELLNPEYGEYTGSPSRTLLCCRSLVVIFMILLILRHVLPDLANGAKINSFPEFLLILLQTLGIILPIYFMLKAVTSLIRRRPRWAPSESVSSDEEGSGPVRVQH